MTLNELTTQGHARNKRLKPEDCVFGQNDGFMLEKWSKDNGVLWSDGKEITASSLRERLGSNLFGVAAVEMTEGARAMYVYGEMSRNDAVAAAKGWVELEDGAMQFQNILLDRKAVEPPAKKLPEMSF